jgi:hypothetical protein
MQQSANINDLLEQWEHIKTVSCPKGDSLDEAIIHEHAKNRVDHLAYSVRRSRLENDQYNEQRYTDLFAQSYNEFTSNFVYRVLKNG